MSIDLFFEELNIEMKINKNVNTRFSFTYAFKKALFQKEQIFDLYYKKVYLNNLTIILYFSSTYL